MMEQHWYEDQKQQHFSSADKKSKRGRSVSLMTLVVCMLITGLIGGAAGGVLSYKAQEQQLVEIQQQLQAGIAGGQNVPVQNTDQTPVATPGAYVPAVAAPTPETYSRSDIIEYASKSIVGIDVEIPGYGWYGQTTETGSGSGVIMSEDGYIITNNHVVAGAENIKVYLHDDTEYPATLVARDEKTDLAVIKIEATGLSAVILGDSDELRVGDDVIAIGNPLGELRGTSTSGMISAISRTVNIEGQDMTLLQTDAAINPGNSGGGLFNMKGELVGVVNAKVASSSVEGLGFAIPINDAKQVVADLIDLGYVSGRAYLGIYMKDVQVQDNSNAQNPNQYGLDNFFGFFGGQQTPVQTMVQVERLVPGGAAEQAGIQVGDFILAVDDKEISNRNTLAIVIRDYSAGDSATITVLREGQELKLPVVFGENIPDGQQ